MLDIHAVHGVVVPVITPLRADEEVDVPALEQVIRHMLNGGVHGLFVLGTTGEFCRLDEEQKRIVAEVAFRTIGRQVPVYYGVSECGTKKVIHNIRSAEQWGADVLVCTLPYYIPVASHKEQFRFFESIIDSTELPMMLYNIPSTVGYNIHVDVIRELAAKRNVIGLKDSSGDEHYLKKVLELDVKPEFKVFVGNEALSRYGLMNGAHGLVPSLGNVFPELLAALYRSCMEGNGKEAWMLQEQLDNFNKLNGCVESWLGPIVVRKAALSLMGIGDGRLTEPCLYPDDEVMKLIRETVHAYLQMKSGHR